MHKNPNNLTNLTKQNKQKYLKPQIFSIANTIKPTNNAHCRSLVDLNHVQTSEEKENNYDHFSSVTSNQDTKNINFNAHYGKNQGKNGGKGHVGNRHLVVDKGNISNIAKILLNASKGKTVENRLQVSSNKNSSSQLHAQGRKNDILMQILNPKQKMQARTSSQTNLRQANTSLTKTSTTKQPHTPSVLQPQKSQKSLKKNPPSNSQQSPHSSLYHQQPHQSHQQTNSPTPINERNLLLKLKQYIQQLKENQQTHLAKIKEISQLNRNLHEEIVLLKDKIQVYQIREREMVAKIKHQEAEIHKLNNKKEVQHKIHQDKNQCQEHLLIIQSLRNVINQQMSKIIEMQTYKVQLNEHKNKNKHKKADDCWQTNQSEPGSEQKHHEVYSFKKRSNLNESSIYIDDQEKQHLNLASSGYANIRAQKQKDKKRNKNYQSIPEPYNQLIKCLKSDSRAKRNSNKNPQEYSHRSSEQMQFESQQKRQGRDQEQPDQYQEASQINEEEFDFVDEVREKGQCSEDQILQEVGQYLQNIRRNIRDV